MPVEGGGGGGGAVGIACLGGSCDRPPC